MFFKKINFHVVDELFQNAHIYKYDVCEMDYDFWRAKHFELSLNLPELRYDFSF